MEGGPSSRKNVAKRCALIRRSRACACGRRAPGGSRFISCSNGHAEAEDGDEAQDAAGAGSNALIAQMHRLVSRKCCCSLTSRTGRTKKGERSKCCE